MLGGIGIGLLSGAKNKKIITIIGSAMIAVGVSGTVAIGSRVVDILTMRGSFGSPELARSYFYGQEAFVILMIGGLALVIFGIVSMQRNKAKQRSGQLG